jgi:hypothetical protein
MPLNPKELFLIDALRATISAAMLGIVLVKFKDTIGMPKDIFYSLFIIPFVFAIYLFVS